MNRVLIVDDDVAVTNYLMVFLMQSERWDTTVVNDSRTVGDLLERERFDLLLLDMDMPGVSGVSILRLLRDRGDQTPVIILTGVSDVELAVRAMKLGAFDYLTKPVDDDHLLATMDAALEHHALQSSIARLPPQLTREELADAAAFELPTRDPTLIRVLHQAERMARSDLSVFLWGERGVGKEQLARAIHKASRRRAGPFVATDAAAQAPDRFPADFFGEARDWSGSHDDRPGFVEEAQGGTLFLENVDQLSLPMQVRLKRVLQTGEYYRERSTRVQKADVRFVVASSEDLTSRDQEGAFNPDLLYHLAVNSLHVPALRARPGDIPLLAEHFLREECQRCGFAACTFAPEAMDLLRRYPFPGNVPELRAVVAAALARAEGGQVTPDALPPIVQTRLADAPT